MEVRTAYNIWAEQYDTNRNRTRDLEAICLRETLIKIQFDNCLEIGCGTGKNTEWLITKAKHILAIDLSEEMLAKAQRKIQSDKVRFVRTDINKEWEFTANEKFDLVTFSLVLEHIENLESVFEKLRAVVKPNGYVYIGELHPFKQYGGTKARFETDSGVQVVNCFNHHISDFTTAATKNGFQLVELKEYFDDNDKTASPRILTLLLQKK
jgi:2-polyprenyl-3-methyl-5-hydroxy-6-metoxy-1,4-benzoquinol methylase